VVVFLLLLSGYHPPPALAAGPLAGCGGSVNAAAVDAEQRQNAATIISVVQSRGLPQRAALIALAVAIQESGLRNVNHGDAAGPDSRGLFQQRASWAPESVRMDPAGATSLFLDALVKVPSWDTLPLGLAAQAVQRSADASGNTYAAHEAQAAAILAGYEPAESCNAAPTVAGIEPGNPLAPECPHPPVTQPFGPTSFAAEPAAHGSLHFHTGIDLACPFGNPVREIGAPGVAHRHTGDGFGNSVVVEVRTQAALYFVRYAHLDAFAVAEGALVKPGDLLGYEGSTGNSTGPHLHFEVDQGSQSIQDSITPASWLSM
jgi:murein DD-endopeptidase MepM/ murein hydrolase activator NlpD